MRAPLANNRERRETLVSAGCPSPSSRELSPPVFPSSLSDWSDSPEEHFLSVAAAPPPRGVSWMDGPTKTGFKAEARCAPIGSAEAGCLP